MNKLLTQNWIQIFNILNTMKHISIKVKKASRYYMKKYSSKWNDSWKKIIISKQLIWNVRATLRLKVLDKNVIFIKAAFIVGWID
jgi:hypothetical protein